ncbi:MAG: hypothetical protein ACC656_00910, partial [Candidatus Heimdallarchaeota archaeon]
MKRQSFLILVSILFLANYHPILAAPGDSIAEAFTANLGEQQGILDAYNDVEYYNFTGETYKYYNFTLVPDPSNYNTMRIYDNQFNLIDENFTGNGPKTLVLNGYENYTIAIYASEFMEIIPGDYSLFITETNGYNTTAGATQSVDTGSYNGTLELYNDVDWYNFSGSADREYNFLVTHPPSLITLLIYDSDLNLVKSNWTVGTINSINQTGKSSYLIAVASSEFVELPINYTLTITDLT